MTTPPSRASRTPTCVRDGADLAAPRRRSRLGSANAACRTDPSALICPRHHPNHHPDRLKSGPRTLVGVETARSRHSMLSSSPRGENSLLPVLGSKQNSPLDAEVGRTPRSSGESRLLQLRGSSGQGTPKQPRPRRPPRSTDPASNPSTHRTPRATSRLGSSALQSSRSADRPPPRFPSVDGERSRISPSSRSATTLSNRIRLMTESGALFESVERGSRPRSETRHSSPPKTPNPTQVGNVALKPTSGGGTRLKSEKRRTGTPAHPASTRVILATATRTSWAVRVVVGDPRIGPVRSRAS